MAVLPGAILVAALALASLQQGNADPLDHVRELYDAADYEGALGALDRLTGSAAPASDAERYRALCFIALGREADAGVAIEKIVRADPLYEPGEQEAPRVRSAFAAVRARVLPDLARARYAEAKAAYDQRDHRAAVPGFERTIAVLDSLASTNETLRDLRTLAAGFLDLSRAAMAPPPTPEPDPVAVMPAAGITAPAVAEPPTEPVALEQALPPWNPAWLGAHAQMEFHGAVEVVIDETGSVTSAKIVATVHPAYDQQLLEAATRWRYEPARRNGQAVTSIKRVDVVLRPRD